MLNAVSGMLVDVFSSSCVISTSLGLEFILTISSRTAAHLLNLPEDQKSSVRLLSILQSSDDAIKLYGFLSEEERSTFTSLISVPGIGARQAFRVLSSMSAQEFRQCLCDSNIRSLSQIPGLGLKTAQKILLTLRDKFVKEEKKTPGNKEKNSRFSDILISLQDMGFDKNQASTAIEKAVSLLPSQSQADEDEIFKKAFSILSAAK